MNIRGKIGVISDTHGLVRPEAVAALAGSELILHAGDIGKPSVLEELEAIAPVVAVRGNIDKGAWGESLPETEAIEINGKFIYLIHNIGELDLNPTGEFDAVIFGHSHKPCNEMRDGVLFFNPASAGPRRFSLPISIGEMHINPNGIAAMVKELDIEQPNS